MNRLHSTLQHDVSEKEHTEKSNFVGIFGALFFGAIVLTGTDAVAAEEKNTQNAQKGNTKALSSEEDVLVVTGEKVNRSIYDSGSSVEVYNLRKMKSIPNPDVNMLLQMTPNVVDNGISNALPAVRGVDGSGPSQGGMAFISGTRPRINVSIDGRSFTYNELAFGTQSLWDIESVEVFRDPQSYIQGRNAIAGAVIIKSLDPTFYWESAIKSGFANQGYQQVAAMASGPLIDEQLAFRLSVDRQNRDSFANLVSYDPVGDPHKIESTTVRAKLLFEPLSIPELSTKLTVNHLDSRAPQNEAYNPRDTPNLRHELFRPVIERKTTSGIWDISWALSDTISLENKLIYTDLSYSRLTSSKIPRADTDGKELEVEPIIRFQGFDNKLNGLVGVRYFHGKQDESINLFGGSKFDDKTETASAYTVLTYTVVPEIDVTLSSRFEREHRTRKGGSESVAIDFDKTYNAFLPKIDVAWKPQKDQTVGVAVGRGYNAGGAGVTFGNPVISYTYDPEYVWNYSLYTRNSLLDGKLELTSNLFYNDYKDMQLPYYLSLDSTMIRNANKVETYGAEIGARWLPVEKLELNANVGLLKTKIKSFAESGVQGNELPRAPGYTANLLAKYLLTEDIDVSGNVMFSDTYYSQYDNSARGKIPAYWIANLQLGYNFKWGRATLFAQNLFDSDKRLLVPDNNVNSIIYQRPRMIGATFELKF
ncbi:TonB-dependent receptor [Photorhabdus temperata]|uniref:TonB-dependent receptor n=1 Tax=Photorhabdus temperata TaxID=574560 RepID=UPI0021D51869|nr:TonB-dependent receptor [Photorhabdus temperata]MCT8347469.1 TonB-dependent receptor [Photorhabdus temperata]